MKAMKRKKLSTKAAIQKQLVIRAGELANALRSDDRTGANILPHGSGIDCKWKIPEPSRRGKVRCSNSFHMMDENGYYCGYQDFTIVLFLVNSVTEQVPSWDFRLEFNGRRSNQIWMLREYLEDTIYYALSEAGILS